MSEQINIQTNKPPEQSPFASQENAETQWLNSLRGDDILRGQFYTLRKIQAKLGACEDLLYFIQKTLGWISFFTCVIMTILVLIILVAILNAIP